MTFPILYHYSNSGINFRPQHREQDRFIFKPHGLWVTPDDEYNWEWWCKAESFRLSNLKHRFKIRLKDHANILWLKTVDDIDQFTTSYRVKQNNSKIGGLWNSIDWYCVIEEFDGILIIPYQWERRLKTEALWYYSWDCSSGCIWNVDMIESYEPDLKYTLITSIPEDNNSG